MPAYPHAFEGRIVHHDLGTLRYTVILLPDGLARMLPFDRHPRLRISGEVGDVPFAGAWQPSRGRWYVMLSKSLLRAGGFAVGDGVEVRFRVEDQEEVEAPEILRRALEADDAARAGWEALSPGKRRGHAHRIASARTAATAARRLAEVLEALRAG